MEFDNNSVLVESLKEGKEKAYVYLLEKFHRILYNYALTLTHNPTLAQDLVQNVFLKTWRHRGKLSPEFPIRSFLYKAVYNEFLNAYQQNKAMMLLHKKYVESTRETVESLDETNAQRLIELINSEIRNLPAKCQRIFILSKKEGLTNHEISEFLNISNKTVENQITKAFKILKMRLEEKYYLVLLAIFNNRPRSLNTSHSRMTP